MRSMVADFWQMVQEALAPVPPQDFNIIPVGTSRRIGKYIVSTVVELAEPEPPPFVTVADCGHCFEDISPT